MDLQHTTIKLFAERADFELDELIPIFHGWIQRGVFPDLMLIDVADYAHVPEGPGVMLIAHEGHLSFDAGAIRSDTAAPGMVYANKRRAAGGTADRITHALQQTVLAASLLESESKLSGRVAFDTSRWLVRFDDLLYLANDDASFELVKPDVSAALDACFDGNDITLSRHNNPRTGLTLDVTITGAPPLAELSSRLNAAHAG